MNVQNFINERSKILQRTFNEILESLSEILIDTIAQFEIPCCVIQQSRFYSIKYGFKNK